jgi:hypothetical protein
LKPAPLCRHRSGQRNQEARPYPVFNHAAGAAFFTPGFQDKMAVYKADRA